MGPAYLHYKVPLAHLSAYEQLDFKKADGSGNFSFLAHREHFAQSAQGKGAQPQPLLGELGAPRVGLYVNATASGAERRGEGGGGGLFFARGDFEDYTAVSRFDGSLRGQPWSLPDGWRAEREWELDDPATPGGQGPGAGAGGAEPDVERAAVGADGAVRLAA